MPIGKRAAAEFFGTFWLVFGGCGAAVLAAGFPDVGIGFARRRPGFRPYRAHHGLRHRTHFRLPFQSRGERRAWWWASAFLLPSCCLTWSRRSWAPSPAAGVLYVIASGKASFDVHAGFASNGYAEHSPGGYSLLAGFVAEVVLTAFFLIVIMGATDSRAPKGFAPIAIGLCLTLIHLVGIPVTNTSVNPARSTGPAIFAGGWALQQLWMFWVAPLIGGALGGGLYQMLFGE